MLEIKNDFNLKYHNTFGLDSKADFFVEIHTISALDELFEDPIYKANKRFVLGGGSNILLTKNIEGLVIHPKIIGINIVEENKDYVFIKSGSGVIWHDFVMYCVKNQYAGVENLSLIPGTVGASPIQNIGAYGVELKDVFFELEAIHLGNGTFRTFKNTDCHFGYRNSVFKNENKDTYLITSVTFRLAKNPILNISYGAIAETLKKSNIENPTIKNISDVVIAIRKSKLPDPKILGNCGSFFKNPEITTNQAIELKSKFLDLPVYTFSPTTCKLAAGWLIEQCGWKGKIIGNTGAHINQALVLVNYGNATGSEIRNLALEIQKSVFQKFGVWIDTEVNVL